MTPADPHAATLAKASERYQDAYAALGKTVRAAFPTARKAELYGVPAWQVKRPAKAPRAAEAGTYDQDNIGIGLVERKAGLTLYVEYAGDYFVLDKHAAKLQAAGFKVMRGCLQFNRKKPFPADALAPLLATMKKADGLR